MNCLKFGGFVFTILLTIMLLSCESEPEGFISSNQDNNHKLSHSDSVAISKMPAYYSFLTTMKNAGYQFIDFRTYLDMDSSSLPAKLIVIRHDVHYRDIQWAYYAFRIEKLLIGPGHSSFYIMLNDPEELSTSGRAVENDYLRLIHYLEAYNVDIQPHISPIDIYVDTEHPSWAKDPADTLKKIFEHNYRWDIHNDGRKLVVTGKDLLNLTTMDHDLGFLLQKYNHEWERETRLPVEGYSAHGSATTANKVINNEYILDQLNLLDTGTYQYDTYNSKILNILSYLSDNKLPSWMVNPSQIKTGRYQMLMHPYQWSVNRR